MPWRRIRAIAIDNEPEPFWTGHDERERVEAWKGAVGWREDWGEVRPAGVLNGPSGNWVKQHVLSPLGLTPDQTWITDCLDTYRCSRGLRARLDDTYDAFAASAGVPPAELLPHPSEWEIVAEAIRDHLGRLRAELATAAPRGVVTLGNAALAVFRELVTPIGDTPKRLVADASYGERHRVRVGEHELQWLPLAHPAAPRRYQEAHARWASCQTGRR